MDRRPLDGRRDDGDAPDSSGSVEQFRDDYLVTGDPVAAYLRAHDGPTVSRRAIAPGRTPRTAALTAELAARRTTPTVMRRATAPDAVAPAGGLLDVALADRGGGTPLPDRLRRALEAELGVPLGGVRIHTDDRAAVAAEAIHARAFTVGHDIYFAAGAFDPDGDDGRRLLRHELTHVVQAIQGRVRDGAGISDPRDALEREAEAVEHDADPAPPGDPFGVHLALAEPGEPLPQRDRIEASLGGHDLGGVQVHRGARATRALRRLGAEGLAAGEHIVLAPDASLHTLVHEAAHVIQQRAGLGAGHDASERAADWIASRALDGRSGAHLLPSPAQAPAGGATSGIGGIVQLAELGRAPPGADPSSKDFLPSVPASTIAGMLGEMRAFAVASADELTQQLQSATDADRARLEERRDAYLAGWYCTVDRSHARLFDAALQPRAQLAALATPRTDGYYQSNDVGGLDIAGFQEGRFGWGADPRRGVAARLQEWLGPEEFERLRRAVPAGKKLVLIGVNADAAAPEASGRDQGAVAGWAAAQVAATTQALQAASDGNGGPGSADKPGDWFRKEAPPKLVAWARGDEMWVNVWLEDFGYGKAGHERSIRLEQGKPAEALLAEVKQAAAELRGKRDSVKGPDAAKKTGFVDAKNLPKYDPKAFGDEAREINAPAYGAEMIAYGLQSPAVTVVGATNRFAMELDFGAAGGDLLSQVTARMQLIYYYWELIELDEQQLEQIARAEKTSDELAAETAVGDPEKSTHVDPFSGIGMDLRRKMRNIATDTRAEVNDAMSGGLAGWAAQSAWLAVVGLSGTVRAIGAVISAIGDMLTVPLNEHSVGFDKPGTFLLRCVATPEPGKNVVRAPSVRVLPIKVVDIKQRAVQENNKDLTRLGDLQAELAAAKDGKEAEAIRSQIKALQASDAANVETLTTATSDEYDATLALIENLETAEREKIDEKEWPTRWGAMSGGERVSTKMLLLSLQLRACGVPLARHKAQVLAQKKAIRETGDRAASVRKGLGLASDKTFRPHVTLASEENGQVTPVTMTLAPVDAGNERHWVLIDLTTDTTAAPRNHYHGKSSKEGPAGHSEAIAQAFKKFSEDHEYGRGTIAIRLPAEVVAVTGGAVNIPPTLRCDPGKRARVMQCLKDLATAAAIAGLFVGGGIGMAIGIAGDLAGAITTVDSLQRHGLHWDLATVMDVISLIGTVANQVRPALPALGRATKLGGTARKVGDAIHIFGVAQAAGQMLVIPYELSKELEEIGNMEGLSPGERAARQLQALLGASMRGGLTVGSIAQMHEGGRVGEKQNEPAIRGERGLPREPAPARNSARLQELQDVVAHSDLAGKKVRVAEHPSLEGDHGRVRAVGDEILIEVGPRATADNVRDHLATARYYERFQGVLGSIAKLVDKITSLIRGVPEHGTRGREASLEIEKLTKILDRLEGYRAGIERFVNETLGRGEAHDATREVDAQIEVLRRQLAEEQALVGSHEPGRGHVDSTNTQTAPAVIERLYQSAEHQRHPVHTFEPSLGTVRVNGLVDVPLGVMEKLLGGAREAVQAARSSHPTDLAALLETTHELDGNLRDRGKLKPEQRLVLEALGDTYRVRFFDRGGPGVAAGDPGKLAHLRTVYPEVARHPDGTKVYRWSETPDGKGNGFNGTTFWQTLKPNADYACGFLVESTLGELRAGSVDREVRLDHREPNQGGALGDSLIMIHRLGNDAVPGTIIAKKIVGYVELGGRPVFEPGDPHYVEPTTMWRRLGTNEPVFPSERAAQQEVEAALATAHGISDPAARTALDAIHRRQPHELLDFLKALRDQPGLANRILARHGDATLTHFTPIGDGMLSIHGEIEISAGKLGTLGEADLVKLVELGKHKGPAAMYEYFESTSKEQGKPGARLRFKSRVDARAEQVVKAILDSLGIQPGDPRAKLFESVRGPAATADAIRLWDLFNERGFKDDGIRKQAAEWAFSKDPKTVRELVAEMQFYDAEVASQATQLVAEARAAVAAEIASQGGSLTDAEIKKITRDITGQKLGRGLDVIGPAAEKAATAKAIERMGQAAGASTAGADAADRAWRTNLDAQAGPDAAGAQHVGTRSDAELPGHLQSIADTLGFADAADGAYHAHKHAKELATRPAAAREMAEYLRAARQFIRDNPGVVRQNQNGSRSVVFEANGMRAIVTVGADGNASLTTFGKST